MKTQELNALADLDPAGLEAAIRECARITAPEVTDAEFERLKAQRSGRYLNTKREMTQAIRAYFTAATSQASVKAMRGALDVAHGKFCKIAGTEVWTDSCLDGWRRSPGALREYAEQAAKEIDAAIDSIDVQASVETATPAQAAPAQQGLARTLIPVLVPDPNSSSGERVEWKEAPAQQAVDAVAKLINPAAFLPLAKDASDVEKSIQADMRHKAKATACRVLALIGGRT